MNPEIVPSDVSILDLLRKQHSMSVTELAAAMGVTATAVRQRLIRLMAQGFIDRETDRAGRGRPSHRYALTNKGRRKTGANFGDLAIALWQEIRAISDPEVRGGLIQRLSRRLAEMYGERIEGTTVEMKMQSIADLFNDRQIPFTVESPPQPNQLPVLTALACPYPDLAEQDRSICSMEKMLFSELLGESVKLSKCRLDGENCCTFEVRSPGSSP
jgi:DeoR family suf operon transcriptional repressor